MSARLLLMGWDAADWSVLHPLIDSGEMPVLGRLVEQGVSGELLSTHPPVTVMQWTSTVTGKRAWQHGVCHPLEMAEDGSRAVPTSARGRRSLAVWQMLAREGRRCLVAGWPATHGEHTPNVCLVSDRFAEPTALPGVRPWPPAIAGTYWPEEIRPHLDPLRMSPDNVQADVISQLVPDWKRVDQRRDRRLGQLRLFLASDFSHQAAMVRLMLESEWDLAVVRFPALGAISQVFAPYLAPRAADVDEEEFELYRGVIAGTCRILDRLLRDLIRAAGAHAGVMVVSPHGIRRKGNAPHPGGNSAAWKSAYGILAVAGPGFARDTLVYGAGVLDVAPTVLAWFGLPIADDMEGRVLMESFVEAPAVSRISTWETSSSPGIAYSGEPAGGSAAGEALERETVWNLAQSCLDAARYLEAIPLLRKLFQAFPERAEVAHALFQCQLNLGLLAEAEQTLELLLEALPPGVLPLLSRAELSVARGEIQAARALVEQLRQLNPTQPHALRRLGLLLLRLREWRSLADLARRAIEIDDTDPVAWLGLAEAELRLGKPAEAEQAATRAIRLKYFLPHAHFVRARALVAQSKWTEARAAMHTMLHLQPANRSAAAYARRLEQA